MKIINVVGTRPQIIKHIPVKEKLKEKGHDVLTVDTGQHYDENMALIHLLQVKSPKPEINLNIKEFTHASQTGRMIIELEKIYNDHKPDQVIVYGDTNSTLAGALSAVKLHIPVCHIEAGVRSHDRFMPEEINRVSTDSISDLLLCSTEYSMENLKKEGFSEDIMFFTGDVLYDIFLKVKSTIDINKIKSKFGVEENNFYILTFHRSSNVNEKRLSLLADIIEKLDKTVVFPIHPRTRKFIENSHLINRFSSLNNLKMIEPVGYYDMVGLLTICDMILTDSGGIQREGYFAGKRSLILRDRTEWVELEKVNWVKVVDMDVETIMNEINIKTGDDVKGIFGDGNASLIISDIITEKGGVFRWDTHW